MSEIVEAKFTAPIKTSNGLIRWSLCGTYIAIASANRLYIRDTSTFQIVHQFTTVDIIQSISWSNNSELVYTAMYKRGVVQVWSVLDPSWTCKINEGIAGIIYAAWVPDSRHIITISDFQLHGTVWSLVDASKYVIRHPKLAGDGLAFSPDGKYLAIVERTNCKDYIGIYNCETWVLSTHFELKSYDCFQILWSPDNTTIAIRDNILEYRVLLYSINGDQLAEYKAYSNALGIKSMSWSPSGNFLALGSYDEHIRLLSHLNWKPILELNHDAISTSITSVNQDAIEYAEQFADDRAMLSQARPQGKKIPLSQRNMTLSSIAYSDARKAASSNHIQINRQIRFEVYHPPFSVLVNVADPLQENPKIGVSRMEWSKDSMYLATKSDLMPHNVWIWHTSGTMKLITMVSLMQAVRSFRWDPNKCRLAICSGDNRIKLWTEGGVSWIDIPGDSMKVLGLKWNPNGKLLALIDKQQSCYVEL